MGAIKPVIRNLKDSAMRGFAQAKDRLHQLANNLTDHLDNLIQRVRGRDRFDNAPDRPLDTSRPMRDGPSSRGQTDGGPGTWIQSPRRTKGEDYQEFITRMTRGTEYNVDGINFDGYDSIRGVLLDAKDWRKFPPVDRDFWHDGTLDEIANQVRAADGVPIEWHFSTQAAKDAVDRLLRINDMVGDITTVFTPTK